MLFRWRYVSITTIHNQKKQLADAALNTAKSLGATYADVRIGRYLNHSSVRRENSPDIGNTESFGVGVRVITKGTWVLPQQ